MRTPMEEPKSFVSIGAPELPPHVATSVLVTSTSAQEQRRMLEAMTRKDFIICNADRTGPVLCGQGQIVPLCDATLVPFTGKNRAGELGGRPGSAWFLRIAGAIHQHPNDKIGYERGRYGQKKRAYQ